MAPRQERRHRYVDIITASFVAVLLISNIAALKIFTLWGRPFDGGMFIFPVSYIFGDILTEVYGYKRSRRVIWTGFFWLLVMNFIIGLTLSMPPEADWERTVGNDNFRRVFSLTPRLAAAGILGYFWGEFTNSYVLAKLKIRTEGRYLWLRTIGSTVVGELVDTAVFCTVAFWGILPLHQLIDYTLTGYVYKTVVEVVMTPVTYAVVGFLKREEHEDYYDFNTNFSPFAFRLQR